MVTEKRAISLPEKWKVAVQTLASVFSSYVEYLKKANNDQKERQSLLHPVRQVKRYITLSLNIYLGIQYEKKVLTIHISSSCTIKEDNAYFSSSFFFNFKIIDKSFNKYFIPRSIIFPKKFLLTRIYKPHEL